MVWDSHQKKSSKANLLFVRLLIFVRTVLALPVPIPTKRENWLKYLFSHFVVVSSKGFMKALKAFWCTSKNCENKNLSYFFLIQLSEMHGVGRGKFARCGNVKVLWCCKILQAILWQKTMFDKLTVCKSVTFYFIFFL